MVQTSTGMGLGMIAAPMLALIGLEKVHFSTDAVVVVIVRHQSLYIPNPQTPIPSWLCPRGKQASKDSRENTAQIC